MRLELRARCARLFGAGMALLTWSAASAAAEPAIHDPATCARPSLWVVSDADTTIYLFGTIHTHDGRTHWFDHAVRRAFDASGELVLETIVPSSPVGITAPQGGGLAAARATIGAGRQIGMSVELGADQVLRRAADAVAKPVIGLEDFAEQLRMYQALPSSAKPTATAAAAAATPSAPDFTPFLRTMATSWDRGDSRPIEQVVDAVKLQSPETYRRLFSDRNQQWASWIAHRLQQPGTVFVAVGTGHLVGTDSVQAKLALAGVRSARVN